MATVWNVHDGAVPNGPKYVPRDFCDRPSLFGRDQQAKFAPPRDNRRELLAEQLNDGSKVSGLDALAEASRLQHEFAVLVGVRLHRNNLSRASLARATGINYRRLGDILAGNTPIRLTDIAAISKALNLHYEWNYDPNLVLPAAE